MADSWIRLTTSTRLARLQEIAGRWQDPEYDVRGKAVAREAERGHRLTDEEIAFAVNQAMDRLVHLEETPPAPVVDSIAVRSPGLLPLDCADLIAYSLIHAVPISLYYGEGAPQVLSGWLSELPEGARSLVHLEDDRKARATDADFLLDRLPDSAIDREEHAPELYFGTKGRHQFVDKRTLAVAIIDGQESADDREGLAEDVLLFSGQSPRSIDIIWAKAGVDADAYFEALAQCRAVYPVHAEIPGTLEMQRAFLEAQDEPHAYAENLEFLVSRGKPEVQRPAHIRWVPFDRLQEAGQWIDKRREQIAWVAAREGLGDVEELPNLAGGPPGEAHRPAFLEQEGGDELLRVLGGSATHDPLDRR